MTVTALISEIDVEIRYVYHISDIHIRNSSRHEEYYEVFEKLYKKIRSESKKTADESLIVITGDVLHSKLELSPQSTNMLYDFLKNLADILPVILIAGNHDCLVSNPDKLDALTPTINNSKELENINYLKPTGFYTYRNIIFGLTNVYTDEPLSMNPIAEKEFGKIEYENKYKIAMYHGAIQGSMTDTGYEIKSERIRAKDFRGYDFGFFGDIHKHQYLNKSKTMAYAGSLIQQNFGESLNGHGILRWDLMTKESKLIEIPNDYGFCKINITNGKMQDVVVPKKPRIMFMLDNTTQEQYKKLRANIEAKYKSCAVVFKQKIPTQIVSNEKYRLKTNNDYEKYIKSYITNKINDKKTCDKIYNLHKKIYEIVVNDSESDINIGGNHWKILELKFSDMFSYGQDNVINFEQYDTNQVIGIIAPNFYGKSSILDIILYVLFGKSSRGNHRNVVNNNKTEMKSSLLFSIGQTKYLIERADNTKPIKAKLILNFYQLNDDGTKKILTGKDRKATQKIIEKLIGQYDDYLTSYICTQDQITKNNFISKTSKDKKEYLYSILKLQIFDQCHANATDKIKVINGQITLSEKNLAKIPIAKSDNDIVTHEATLSSLNNKRRMLKSIFDLNKITLIPEPTLVRYHELSEYKIDNDDDIIHVKAEIQSKLNLLKHNDLIEDIQTQKKSLAQLKKKNFDDDITASNLKIQQLREQIISIPKNHVNTDVDSIKKEITAIKNKISAVEEEASKLLDAKEIIESSPNGEVNKLEHTKIVHEMKIRETFLKHVKSTLSIVKKCDDDDEHVSKLLTLQDNWITNHKKWVSEHDEWITQSESLIDDKLDNLDVIAIKFDACNDKQESLNDKISTLKERINDYKLCKIDMVHNEKIQAMIDTEIKRLDKLKTNKITNKRNIDKLKKSIDDNNKLLASHAILKNNLSLVNSFKDVLCTYNKNKAEYDHSRGEYLTVQKELFKNKHDISSVMYNIENCKKVKREYDELSDKIVKLKDKVKIYELYRDMVHVNGMPYDILKTVLPRIESAINQTLSNMVNFSVEIMSEKTKANGTRKKAAMPIKNKVIKDIEVNICHDNKNPYSAQLASGFEKFIIGIAIRLVLCDISASAKPNFFIIDEGWSCLDSENLSNIDTIITYIKNQFDHTIIISHIENIKNQADNIINIEKTRGYSHVSNRLQN